MAARSSLRARGALAAVAAISAAFFLAIAFRSRGGTPSAPPAAQPARQQVEPQPAAAAAPPVAATGPTLPLPTASEDELMARLRAEVDVDPRAAIALADDGERRFPASHYGDERAFLRMRGLVHLGDIGVARDAARVFYERYPDSPLGRYVFRLTGMRPMPPLGPPGTR